MFLLTFEAVFCIEHFQPNTDKADNISSSKKQKKFGFNAQFYKNTIIILALQMAECSCCVCGKNHVIIIMSKKFTVRL